MELNITPTYNDPRGPSCSYKVSIIPITNNSYLTSFLNYLCLLGIRWIYPPPRIPVANEGLGWDSLLKMVHNPGGDWHPGWGVDRSGIRYTST